MLRTMLITFAAFLFVSLLTVAEARSGQHSQRVSIQQPHDLPLSWQTVERIIYKIQKCKPETKLELLELVSSSLGDFQACINVTRDIADFEEFFYHTFNYILLTNKNLYGVAKTAFACHNQSNIFEVLKCVITTLQDSGPEFNEIFDSALKLVDELQEDVTRLILNIKECFTHNNTAVFETALPLIHNNC